MFSSTLSVENIIPDSVMTVWFSRDIVIPHCHALCCKPMAVNTWYTHTVNINATTVFVQAVDSACSMYL